MAMPFEQEEIDDLDETLLQEMDHEELVEFKDQLLETLDGMQSLEPVEEEDEDAYYEWEDRISVLQDMIDAIDELI